MESRVYTRCFWKENSEEEEFETEKIFFLWREERGDWGGKGAGIQRDAVCLPELKQLSFSLSLSLMVRLSGLKLPPALNLVHQDKKKEKKLFNLLQDKKKKWFNKTAHFAETEQDLCAQKVL